MAFSLLPDKADRNATHDTFRATRRMSGTQTCSQIANSRNPWSSDLHGIFHVFSNGEAGAKGSEGTESQKRAKRSANVGRRHGRVRAQLANGQKSEWANEKSAEANVTFLPIHMLSGLSAAVDAKRAARSSGCWLRCPLLLLFARGPAQLEAVLR